MSFVRHASAPAIKLVHWSKPHWRRTFKQYRYKQPGKHQSIHLLIQGSLNPSPKKYDSGLTRIGFQRYWKLPPHKQFQGNAIFHHHHLLHLHLQMPFLHRLLSLSYHRIACASGGLNIQLSNQKLIWSLPAVVRIESCWPTDICYGTPRYQTLPVMCVYP